MRYFAYLLFLLAILSCFACQSTNTEIKEAAITSLAERYKDYFPIGAAVGQKELMGKDSTLLRQHFSSLTAENDMKPARTLAALDQYTFDRAQPIVDFAAANNMKLRGHTLVWHNQTPDWFFKNEVGEDLSKTELLNRLQQYIQKVVTQYKGKVYAWDVVNEAISDQPEPFYRTDTDWFKICGADFIEMAFRYAHAADPTAKLFYNDYSLINPKKRDKTYDMVKELLEKGVPIHGIGMQGHWNLESINKEKIIAAVDTFASLGVEVQITELDLSVYSFHRRLDATEHPPALIEYSDSLAAVHTAKYVEIFDALRSRHEVITGVTFWGVSDGGSWLNNFFVKGRTDHPLLFDRQYQPKPALAAIMDF